MASSNKDPMEMSGLDPLALGAAVDGKKSKIKPPNELDVQKEARLAAKEQRLTSVPKAGLSSS